MAAPWSGAQLLKLVCALDMTTCPFCQRGALRIMAIIMQGEGSSKRL